MEHQSAPKDPPILFAPLLGRVQAALVDLLAYTIVFLLSISIVGALQPASTLLRGVLIYGPLLFLEPLLLSCFGCTVGYYCFNQQVTKSRSNKFLNFPQALIRFLLKILLGGFSLLFMLVTNNKQAIHDLLVGSVVTVRDPAKISQGTRRFESAIEESGFTYPSKLRRIFVIILYAYAGIFIIWLTLAPGLSAECLDLWECGNASDRELIRLIRKLYLVPLGASMYLGWRGRLFGARRKAVTSASK